MSAQQVLAVLCLVFLVGQAAAFVVQSNEYCPINPRKAGQTLVPNGEAFSFLLTCPLGQPKFVPGQGNWQDLYYAQSPNSYAQSTDTDVFLYQSAFSNGVNDPRQGACISWEHAFYANSKTHIFTTGSGKPVIVGQDARFLAADFFVNNTGNEYISKGQWLYSICDDETCASATVPKPFWGRRIGEPLFQDTMAELAYFPFPPDWAYNSPRLGTTLYDADGFDSNNDVLNPTEIASTYVYTDDGEKLLVLLVNGQAVGKNVFDTQFEDISENNWYLTWCQDEDCTHWAVYDLDIPRDVSNLDADSLRGSLATGADGQTIYVVTRASLPQTNPLVLTLKLVDISPGAGERNRLMQEIYYQLIGGPAALDGLQVSTPTNDGYPFLTIDAQIALGTIGPDVHPLNYAYGGRGYRLSPFGGPRRPAIACVDLEDTGVQSDPWCTWTTYWEIVDSTGTSNSVGGNEPLQGALYDAVYDECSGELYVISSPAADYGQSLTSASYTVLIVNPETGDSYEWPPVDTNIDYFENDLNIPAPYPATWLRTDDTDDDLPAKGRRISAITGANGRPFFTWADLNNGLYDSAPVVWGTCAVVPSDSEDLDYECRTILDSIELGTMGFLHVSFGQTLLLRAPDGLPVMIYWFDHFGGSPLTLPGFVEGNTGVQTGLVTNKPLIVLCLDAYCDSASVATFTPSQLADIINRPSDPFNANFDANPFINAGATFADDDTLILLLNEGGRWDEATGNPLRLWRTNRWASPTGLPCSEENAGSTAVADGVVYYCTRIRVGSDDAELYVGTLPRPWARLYEWVRMDWGYPLRNLGGFLGWGASYGDDSYIAIATDKDPWWTDNSQTYLNRGGWPGFGG